MAARRCVLHGSFPSSFSFQKCPVCGESTDFVQNADPDENWERAVAMHQERTVRSETVAPEIPVLEGAKVTVEDGEFFISTWDVVNGGVRHRLRLTDLVQVGKQAFEILEYRYAERRYLVQPFSLTLSDDDLTALLTPPPGGDESCTQCSSGS